ncbi:MAG: OB-fold nucleic acid binding domain-containing protein [Nanoarchaeota archaeon]
MKERHLVVISIIVLVLGMGFLVLYAEEADLVPLARLEENQVEQYVRVTGTIEQLRAQDKVWFLQVMGERTEMVNIIFFPEEDIFLEEGNMVEIEGVVEEYEGKKEVVAHSIVIK